MRKLMLLLVAAVLLFAACSEQSESQAGGDVQIPDEASATTALSPSPSILDGLDITQIAVGTAPGGQSFYLTSDGRVFARGENRHGTLGVGDFEEHEGLVQVRIPEPIRLIGSGVAVTYDNHIYVWGTQYIVDDELRATLIQPEGRFSLPFTFVSTPVKIEFGKHIVQIYNSWGFTNILTEDGEVYTFGAWYEMPDLEPPVIGRYYPSQNPQLVLFPERIVRISSGYSHTLALGESGTLYGFGVANYEQLGIEARRITEEQHSRNLEQRENVLRYMEDYIIITDRYDISVFAANSHASFFVDERDPTLLRATGFLTGVTSLTFPLQDGFAEFRLVREIAEIIPAVDGTSLIVKCVNGDLYGLGMFNQDFFNVLSLGERNEDDGVTILREPALIEVDIEIGTILPYGSTIYFTDAEGRFATFNAETERSETVQFEFGGEFTNANR
jgi:alpha-tubulin suppressor-like RCC1 family protein